MRAPGFTFVHSLLLMFGLVGLGLFILSGASERALAAREEAWPGGIREGDVIFQDLACGQRCSFIRQVTHSRYVHVGLVLLEGGERGRPYDADYQWDEERIYCSELIIKAFAADGAAPFVQPHTVTLGSLRAQVAALSAGRLTEETLMVTPRDLAESPRLRRVVDELVPR